MSDQNATGKPKYESPIVVPLGEMAKGSGVCTTGSSVVAPSCTAGAVDAAVIDCTAGSNATQDCTAGPTATRDCTAGTNAIRACTAGTAATSACTAGTSL
jgi:hypothetical protein